MKIYFAGSIRGGREKQDDYRRIIQALSTEHEVLSEHIGSSEITQEGQNLSAKTIFQQDIEWLDEADLVIAEVSQPSIGVGYEIGRALSNNKRVICIYDNNSRYRNSAMIEGNSEITLIKYEEVQEIIKKIFEKI